MINYPYPSLVSGNKNDLIRSYKKDIYNNKNYNYPNKKDKSIFRICSYNVNSFTFLYRANKLIYKFNKGAFFNLFKYKLRP